MKQRNYFTSFEGQHGRLWSGGMIKKMYRNNGLLVFLFCCFLFIGQRGFCQSGNLIFEHISMDDGLSDNSVYAIVQDEIGFLWFATQNGLNRYDGYSFTVIKNTPLVEDAPSNDNMATLLCDGAGSLWIGTWGGGLNVLDTRSGVFKTYLHDPEDPTSLSHNRVQFLYQDGGGSIWIGTAGGGLNRFNKQTESFEHFFSVKGSSSPSSHQRIWAITSDGAGMLWIGTSNGLLCLDPESGHSRTYHRQSGNTKSLSHDIVRSLCYDRQGTLWVGTEDGLNRFNPKDDSFTQYHHDPDDEKSLSDNTVNKITEDSRGRFWIGTRSGGLNLFDRHSGAATRHMHDNLLTNSLSYNDVRDIFEDTAGVIWIATRGGGINKLVPTSGQFQHHTGLGSTFFKESTIEVRTIFKDSTQKLWVGLNGGGIASYDPMTGQTDVYKHDSKNAQSISSNDVYAMREDKQLNIWIGYSGAGLTRFSPETQQFTHYKHRDDSETSLSNDDVSCIFLSSQGQLWIGTKGGGLNRFNQKTEEFTSYQVGSDPKSSLSNNDVYAITEDGSGNIWIGTYGGGVNCFRPHDESFQVFQSNPERNNCLSNNNIFCLYRDRQGILWIGTANGGLNRFNPANGKFSHFSLEHGLASDVVYSIEEDNEGFLWLATNIGLSKFHPSTFQVINYDARDGLERVIYRQNASCKSADGRLYFGGINGFTSFLPATITVNDHVPPIVLTEISILNKPLKPVLKIIENDLLDLNYRDNIISFSFTALDFTNSQKNSYAYKLEGFDTDWVFCNTRRFVTYTNLNPGFYTFQVKGTNNTGLWNEKGLRFALNIKPPFWRTWWFQGTAVFIVLGIVFIAYSRRVHNLERRRKLLEEEVAVKTRDLVVANTELKQLNNRLQNELMVARKIQKGLLPEPRPDWKNLDVICYSKPAFEVGGDFYDYYLFPGSEGTPDGFRGRMALIVGDVSGKGMPAALLMAVSLGYMQSIIGQSDSPHDFVGKMDRTLKPFARSTNQYCALCYVEIVNQKLHVINTGGITPILRKSTGQTHWIEATGLPLGVNVEEGPVFTDVHKGIDTGDMIIIVSDGVLETMNQKGELLGFNLFEKMVHDGPQGTAETMLQYLIKALKEFLEGQEPQDDMTLIVAKM